jgi:tRNA (mo5U34)-methyltransferase
MSATDISAQMLERAEAINWYHSMELAPGHATEGEFDLRPLVRHYGIPDDLNGKRAIDVATFNGFWAFELERRGAEVVALDLSSAEEIDWPALRPRYLSETPLSEGFHIAHAIYGSSAERIERSVYEVTPEEVGTFDLVFCGSMLIHMKNQFRALERMQALLRPGGLFITCEPYHLWLSLLRYPAARYRAHRIGAPVFWEPSVKAWGLMTEACGFADVTEVSRFKMRSPRGYSVRHVVHHATSR